MELATPLKIEAGKYYLTRDGKKVVPMRCLFENFIEFEGDRRLWTSEGVGMNEARGEDLIAEWVDELVATPTTGTAIVCLIKDGKPAPVSRPYVHETGHSANVEAGRLAGVHKGDTFGVYVLRDTVRISTPEYDHEWQRLAASGQKIAAIKELRSITGLGLRETKLAVEGWLAAA
jgi:hypothetical protein